MVVRFFILLLLSSRWLMAGEFTPVKIIEKETSIIENITLGDIIAGGDTLILKIAGSLRNEDSGFGKKLKRGIPLNLGAQGITLGFSLLLPADFTRWDIVSFQTIKENFREAYRNPPVIDHDEWYVNYVGHSYQGANYFNAYRSQGARFWQSALASAGHSVIWEYVFEAGFEPPSIQDLIVTPAVGSLVGEIFHLATLRMSRNGFKWYEKAIVTVINPMYVLNNGYK